MAQPFKDQFNGAVLDAYVAQLKGEGFAEDLFRTHAAGLESLELKARVQRIADAMAAALPPFPRAAEIVRDRSPASLPDASAVASTFVWWPLCTYVECHGLQHPDLALSLLKHLTTVFSAEFAVRPFLANDPLSTLAVLAPWCQDPNVHVRRWVSEGTRPRLPWGLQLRTFVADPSPTLPLLDALVDDPEPYVRRSVANHLGDIAKDHPDLAVQVARGWLAASDSRRDIVRHGLRHLIKQGHPAAMDLFGYAPPQLTVELALPSPKVRLGGALELTATLQSTADVPQDLVVDLAVRFMGANGLLRAPKVFKGTQVTLPPQGATTWTKKLAMAAVTTRTHYPGEQELHLRVNGQDVAMVTFELSRDSSKL